MEECPFGMRESMFGSQENRQMSFDLWSSSLLFCSPERSCLLGGIVTKSCPTLCDLKDYSPPGCSVHGIFQARILEWVAVSFFRESSWPRNRGFISCILYCWATREASSICLHPCIHAYTVYVCSVSQSCLTFCDPLDCSPPGSSARGIFQARILECIAISPSRGSSRHRDRTRVLLHCRQILYHWAIREAHTQYIHTFIYTHTYIHVYAHTHTFVHTHTYRCICKCVCTMYTCVNVFHEIGSMLLWHTRELSFLTQTMTLVGCLG